MHKSTIIFLASLLLPALAAPVPVDQISGRGASIVEPRRDNAVIGLASDILKRGPNVEPIPVRAVYDSDDMSKRDAADDEEDVEEENDDEELELVSESLEERGLIRRPGGNPKRGLIRRPGGNAKRGLIRKPGGNAKRGLIRRPGGSPKRGLIRRPGGNAKRGLIRTPGGNAKRGLIRKPGGNAKRGLIRRPGGNPKRSDDGEHASIDRRNFIQRTFDAILG